MQMLIRDGTQSNTGHTPVSILLTLLHVEQAVTATGRVIEYIVGADLYVPIASAPPRVVGEIVGV